MFLSPEQKKIVIAIQKGEVYDAYTYVKFIYLNIDSEVIIPFTIENPDPKNTHIITISKISYNDYKDNVFTGASKLMIYKCE